MPTLPLKTYLIAAATIALLSWLGWFALHERGVQHAKDVAVATKAVARVAKADAVIEAKANTEIQHDQLIYKQIVALPPVDDLGVVCSAPGGDTVSGSATSATSGDAGNAHPAGSSYDPSGEALTVGRDADAKIAALQAIIASLRREMEAAAKVHK